ncbi:MAG: aminoglycoside adenylyltransferase domain-containing protein [Bacillota bacterium]
MQSRARYPTPFPEVNALLDRLRSELESLLGHRLTGLYLHGSLALGGFDPRRSDIDYLAVTAEPLSDPVLSDLAELHRRIGESDHRWVIPYEGSYIPVQAIRRHDPARSLHPVIRVDGSFGVDRHGGEWIIQRHLIRERGITLVGPPPESLIDPVTPGDLRLAVCHLMREWWEPQLRDPHRLRSSEYQAYAVLTMCRVLYTLRFGSLASKPEAARWAQQTLDQRWAGLIEGAMAWRRGGALDCMEEALALIRFTLGHLEG